METNAMFTSGDSSSCLIRAVSWDTTSCCAIEHELLVLQLRDYYVLQNMHICDGYYGSSDRSWEGTSTNTVAV